MLIKGGSDNYDTPIGIICLDSKFPKPSGHIRNPTTFKFPTIQHVVKGVDVKKLLFERTPELIEPFVQAAKELEQSGVEAISGSCGFLALYQKEIAAAVNIPVFLSSLLQVPLIQMMYSPNVRIGILTASQQALTSEHLQGVGIVRQDNLFIKGMEGKEHFWTCIVEGEQHDFDMKIMEQEVRNSAKELKKQYDVDVLVLECTDLSAFSASIQEEVQVPIFDINTLVELTQSALWRITYNRHRFL